MIAVHRPQSTVYSPQSAVHSEFLVPVWTGDRGPGTGDR